MGNKIFVIFLIFLSLHGAVMTNKGPSIQKIGHRGASGYEPENSLRSFKKALELDVDMVELDVHLCKTNQIVVIHDNKVNRTTNGKGKVKDLTLNQLKQLDAGKDERIPTLSEVLNLIKRKVKVVIELKGEDTELPVANLIKKYVKKGWKYSDFLVISFKHNQIYRIRDKNFKVKLGLLFKKPTKELISGKKDLTGISHLIFNYKNIDQKTVDLMHKKNIKIFAYTINKLKDIKQIKALGVDGIVSDYPDKI